MNKLIAVALLSCLPGCYQVTSAGDISAAQAFCEDNGGINHVTVYAINGEHVTCQNEAKTFLHKK